MARVMWQFGPASTIIMIEHKNHLEKVSEQANMITEQGIKARERWEKDEIKHRYITKTGRTMYSCSLHECGVCNETFPTKRILRDHRFKEHSI